MKAAKKFLSPATRRRITKMIEYVTAHPEQLDQNSYPESSTDQTVDSICGTPFCAAGHAVIANDTKRFKQLVAIPNAPWRSEALKALKLYDSPIIQQPLFGTVSSWPYRFSAMYYKASSRKTTKARVKGIAAAFAARWQHILDTDAEGLQY